MRIFSGRGVGGREPPPTPPSEILSMNYANLRLARFLLQADLMPTPKVQAIGMELVSEKICPEVVDAKAIPL